MNSGFAGSASHDDRRRRRLLTEQNEDGVDGTAMVLSRSVIESSRNHRFPVKRILHYRVWRLCLLSFVMAMLLGGLLYGSWRDQHENLGPGFSLLFDQTEGRLFKAIPAVILLLSGHLCGLIGWARSRSPNDFRGRYRVWKPIALVFYLAALGVVIRADEILNAFLQFAAVSLPWDVPEWNWMIPTAGLAAIMTWIINREMAISNLSRVHAWLGLTCLVSGLALPFVPENQFQIASMPLVEQGLIVGGLMMIGLSLMWFGRQVLYISSDPAERKPSLILRMLKSLFRKRASKTKKARKSSGSDTASKSEADSSDTKPVKKTTTRRRGRRKSASKPAQSESSSSQTDKEELPSQTSDPSSTEEKETPRLKLRAADISVGQMDQDILQERLDMMELLAEEGEALDQDLLKGLTKKQKKQLRSAWRDLERQYSQRRAG